MKTFIVRSVILFILSGVATTAVFLLVKNNLPSVAPAEKTVDALNSVVTEANTLVEEKEIVKKLSEKIPEQGIALSSLKLSDAQEKILSAANIDVNTFTITPAMLMCAGEKIGAERVAALSQGESPTLIELTKLVPCLN